MRSPNDCSSKDYSLAPTRSPGERAGTEEGASDSYRQKILQMEADVILKAPGRRIILDAKNYQDALGGRFGGKLHSQNFYPLLAFLRC